MNILCQSANFTAYQCDQKRCFYLTHAGKEMQLSCCQFIALRQKVNSLDLSAHFDGRNPSGIEILSVCNRAHLLILDTHQVLELKNLLRASFGFMEFNSLV